MSHTPAPWYLWYCPTDRHWYVLDSMPVEGKPFTGQVVAIETSCPDSVENLGHIVAVVNSHAALLAACRLAAKRCPNCHGTETAVHLRGTAEEYSEDCVECEPYRVAIAAEPEKGPTP